MSATTLFFSRFTSVPLVVIMCPNFFLQSDSKNAFVGVKFHVELVKSIKDLLQTCKIIFLLFAMIMMLSIYTSTGTPIKYLSMWS